MTETHRQKEPESMEIRCPKCRGWLGEASGYARLVCRTCNVEVIVRDRKAAAAS